MPALVINRHTGELVSVAGSVKDVADPLDIDLEAITVTKLPDLTVEEWDPKSRRLRPIPPPPPSRRDAALANARKPGATLEQKVDALLELLAPPTGT